MADKVQFGLSTTFKFRKSLPCRAIKDQLDRVRAVRANSNLTQARVLDTQPMGYPN